MTTMLKHMLISLVKYSRVQFHIKVQASSKIRSSTSAELKVRIQIFLSLTRALVVAISVR